MNQIENTFTIYPIYLDSSLSLGNGRKYGINVCIEKPTFKEIRIALDSLNIVFKEDESKIHPKEQREKGIFIVNNKCDRKEIITKLINFIKEARIKKEQNVDKSKSTNNLLNLRPKSKKKSKNN